MINNGRLQFAHKSTIFSNRHVACAFIEKYVEEYGVLIGEPIIVRYNKGEENGTAAILAVGEGDKYQLIDIELINEDIERINENHAATDSFVYRLYSQFISEMERNISKDKEIDTTIDFLRNQITTNNLVSINTDLNSTSSYIRVTENGTEAVIDVKLDDNGCEFLKHSGNGLSDLGIKDYVNGECEVVKDMVRSLNDNNKNEHLLFERDIEKINDKIGTGFAEETITKSVSDIKNKLNIFFDENAISDNTINTLKEIQEYISSHGSDATEMVNNITANTSAIAKEVADRKADVSGLQETISEMDETYKAADAALEVKISAETAARETAVSAEANVRREKDDELDSKIVKLSQKDAANHQEALNKISSLNDLLIVLSGVVENNESDIEAKLNTETQERIDLDKREINHHNFLLNKLSNVDNEIQTLKTEDNNIKSRIQTVEESYAKNIDLNNEILRAKNSEENLNQKLSSLENTINDEIKENISSTLKLAQKGVDDAAIAQGEVDALETVVSDETKARQDADAALDAKISAETAAREAADTNLAQTNSIQHEEIKGSISTLTNEVNAYATKIDIIDEREASHHTDLSNEINSLSTQLATLSAVTQTADNVQSTITNNINTLDSIVSGESSDLEVTLIQQNGKLSSISITQKGDFTNETISKHTSNGDIHVTELDKDNWNRAKNDIDIFLNDNAISDQTVNTLKEIQEYINNHGEEAAVMVNNIATISAATENNKTTITTTNERITVLETNLTNEINNREKGDDDVKNWVAGQNYLPRSEYEKYDDSEVSANVQGLIAKDEELLAKIEANASAITKEIADREAAVSAETVARVEAVSGLQETISEMVEAYQTKDAELLGNIEANTSAISTNTYNITTLSGTVSEHTEQLANCVIKQSGHTINEENLSDITFVAKTVSDPTHAEFTIHKTNDEDGVDRYGISIMVNDEEGIEPHVTISANKTALFVTEDGVFVGEGRDIEDSNFDGKKVVTESSLTNHTSNADIHVTTTDKNKWNAAAEAAQDAKAAIDAFLDKNAVSAGLVDTLKEIQEYITTDGAAADKMVKDIAANASAISAETATRKTADEALQKQIDEMGDVIGTGFTDSTGNTVTDKFNSLSDAVSSLTEALSVALGRIATLENQLKSAVTRVESNDPDLSVDQSGNIVTIGFNREEDNSRVAEE